MSNDLSRRNFLKGLMVTAGVAAVGLPAIAAAEVAPGIIPPPLPFPGLPGDVFLKVNNVWRFMSRLTSLSMQRPIEVIEMRSLGSFPPAFHHGLQEPPEIDMTMYFDREGQQLLATAFYNADIQEMAIAMRTAQMFVAEGRFAAMDFWHHALDERFLQGCSLIESKFVPTASPQLFFQAGAMRS